MSVVTPTILSDGQEIDPAFSLLAVDVTKEVMRIPRAELSMLDGTPATGDFPASNSAFFEPGKEIEIKLRYEGEADVTVFKGKVARQAIRAGSEGSVLTLDLSDAAIKLTRPRRSKVFRDITDGDIFGRLIEEAGLSKGEVAATEPEHGEIVQYYASDWDFMLMRAEILGLLVAVDDGVVSARAIDLSGEASRRFEFGVSEIFDCDFELDATHQHAAVESVGWDVENQQRTEAATAADFALAQGNLDGGSLAESFGFEACVLSHPVPVAPDELQGWANARMTRDRLAMIRGRLSVRGDAAIKPFDLIELAGLGDRFNGNSLVTGVRHRIDQRGWRTDIQFGLSPERFGQRAGIRDAPAAGVLPASAGLQIGIVDAFEEDPDQQLRVRVSLPTIGAEDAYVWARLASPDAGSERGFFFRPETGDEVVVGFFNNDPRQAVILGAMYSSANAAPQDFAELSEDNLNKGIVTKRGSKIRFLDDEKASILVETAQSNKLLLDDDAEAITIEDQHGNAVVMDGNGIQIKSGGDLKIEASGKIEIKGQEVDIK